MRVLLANQNRGNIFRYSKDAHELCVLRNMSQTYHIIMGYDDTHWQRKEGR